MSQGAEQQPPRSRARRHFLGVAGATGAKVAATMAVLTTFSSLPAQAMGRKVWRHDGGATGSHGGESGASPVSNPVGNSPGSQSGSHTGSEPNCFLRGTAIMTPAGEVRIEDLRVGDLVETVRGQAMPVKWIGRQRYRKNAASWQKSVMPIRVARNALAEGVPHRDLYLSPSHALYIDGVLMRVKELVNGISITHALPADREEIEYFNIVLDSHEAILAEGTPAETFLLRADNHENFANFVEFERLYAADRRMSMTPFAPVVGYEGGREHLTALLRMGASRFMRTRDPIQAAYEKFVNRARVLAC
jgi:hypothetical protein